MLQDNYYIGIDIGTTSTKAIAFARNGDIMAKHEIPYPIEHPRPGYNEQNPNTIFNAVLDSIGVITAKLSTAQPAFISFSSAMHSLILVDENCKPLTQCMIWADNRASETAEQLRQSDKATEIYHATGVPIHAMSPLCKLLWLKENNLPLFMAAHKFIGVKEYILYRLFGEYVIDTAIASATGFFNIHQLKWDEQILDYAGIGIAQLSDVVSARHKLFLPANGAFTKDKRLLLTAKTAYVIGGGDGGLANLGSGATKKNSMAVTVGTSSAVRMVTPDVYTDAEMRTFCYHIGSRDNYYIIGGASNNGAVVLQWLKENMLQAEEDYDALTKTAEKIPAACDGLLFIPYIMGERAPVWNSDARGVFFGLDINHSRAHLVRATMEAIVFSMYSIGKILMEKRTVKMIHATGGFTRNPLWLQILCDMFNRPVQVANAVESSALGAVKIGLEAIGEELQMKPVETEIYEPDALQHQIYLRQFEKFERVYDLLKDEMALDANYLRSNK